MASVTVAALTLVVALAQLRFLLLCLFAPRLRTAGSAPLTGAELPRIALQIATFREARALPEVLAAALRLDWPRDRLTVQILDDSSGADAAATDVVVASFRAAGLPCEILRRGSRAGFKAGALNHGLRHAGQAEAIAYCDADCRLAPDFLRRAWNGLQDPAVAAVQTFWSYPNGGASPLTAAQEAAFLYLFRFDYEPRAVLGLPVYYLGSSALWKRAAIDQLDGFAEQPFTAEDVDLSFRAAAAGWRIACLPATLSEDDALVDVLTFRAQQRRWARAVGRAVFDAAPGILARRTSLRAALLERTAWLPHASIPLFLGATLALAIAMLLGPSGPAIWSAWVLTLCYLASPGLLALVLAVRTYRPDVWQKRVLLLLRAGPVAAATMTSFVFGLIDLLSAARAEFVVTSKRGERPILRGSTRSWLTSHLAPLVCDLLFAAILVCGAIAAVLSRNWIAAIPTALLGVWFIEAFGQGVRAWWTLRQSDSGRAPTTLDLSRAPR